ncbi:tyrosine-protein phosphatase [Nocardia sp. NPDC059239]|uniref:tyrosine-protein phosphatase n=1 Tax=Nocardia sp. NPDC059239 TaxID=3346785 RepID=UPI0036CF2FE3
MPTPSRAGQGTQLSGAWNFRDVGSSHSAKPGIASGVLFRASALNRLDTFGQRTMIDLGIGRVVDLRSRWEIDTDGADAVPAGVEVVVRSFHRDAGPAAALHTQPRLVDDGERFSYMVKAYRSFIRSEGASDAIRTVANALTDERQSGGVLVHCAAGKDRTGWVVATVLAAAGVDRAAIATDFLRSNEAVDHLRAVQRRRGVDVDLSSLLLGVRSEYLDSAFSAATEVHGSFGGYLESIGIGPAQRRQLREILVP